MYFFICQAQSLIFKVFHQYSFISKNHFMIFVKRFASPAGPDDAAAYVAALRKKALNWRRVTFFTWTNTAACSRIMRAVLPPWKRCAHVHPAGHIVCCVPRRLRAAWCTSLYRTWRLRPSRAITSAARFPSIPTLRRSSERPRASDNMIFAGDTVTFDKRLPFIIQAKEYIDMLHMER